MAIYKDRGIKLRSSKFSFKKDNLKNVDLWNIAPVWPGTEKATLTEEGLADFIAEAYHRSSKEARMVLWMPATNLHRTPFEPVDMSTSWIPKASIISGSHPVHIGYVYSKSQDSVCQNTKFILDERGKCGASSTSTVKFILEKILHYTGNLVVDPFAHKSGILPTWCRRNGITYCGYMGSKKRYEIVSKALAQVELPGIQMPLSHQ